MSAEDNPHVTTCDGVGDTECDTLLAKNDDACFVQDGERTYLCDECIAERGAPPS